jgi:hypothetical protein
VGGAASGCAVFAPPPMGAALRARPPAGLPPRVMLEGVPFVPQGEQLCGPAVLAMLMAQAGRPQALATLQEAVWLPARGGTLQTEMLAAPRRFGLLATRLPPRLEAVLQELAAGCPVGVLQNLGLSFAPRWHYAVITGHDLGAGELRLHSGETPDLRLGLVPFEHTWARGGHWAFVLHAPGTLPLTATREDLIASALGFGRVAPPGQQAEAWDALLARWPDDLVMRLGRGNARHAGGDLAGAAEDYEAAARRHDSAAAWNNLAQTRLQQGQRAPALAAAQRALQRAREAEPAWREACESTWREVMAALP